MAVAVSGGVDAVVEAVDFSFVAGVDGHIGDGEVVFAVKIQINGYDLHVVGIGLGEFLHHGLNQTVLILFVLPAGVAGSVVFPESILRESAGGRKTHAENGIGGGFSHFSEQLIHIVQNIRDSFFDGGIGGGEHIIHAQLESDDIRSLAVVETIEVSLKIKDNFSVFFGEEGTAGVDDITSFGKFCKFCIIHPLGAESTPGPAAIPLMRHAAGVTMRPLPA